MVMTLLALGRCAVAGLNSAQDNEAIFNLIMKDQKTMKCKNIKPYFDDDPHPVEPGYADENVEIEELSKISSRKVEILNSLYTTITQNNLKGKLTLLQQYNFTPGDTDRFVCEANLKVRKIFGLGLDDFTDFMIYHSDAKSEDANMRNDKLIMKSGLIACGAGVLFSVIDWLICRNIYKSIKGLSWLELRTMNNIMHARVSSYKFKRDTYYEVVVTAKTINSKREDRKRNNSNVVLLINRKRDAHLDDAVTCALFVNSHKTRFWLLMSNYYGIEWYALNVQTAMTGLITAIFVRILLSSTEDSYLSDRERSPRARLAGWLYVQQAFDGSDHSNLIMEITGGNLVTQVLIDKLASKIDTSNLDAVAANLFILAVISAILAVTWVFSLIIAFWRAKTSSAIDGRHVKRIVGMSDEGDLNYCMADDIAAMQTADERRYRDDMMECGQRACGEIGEYHEFAKARVLLNDLKEMYMISKLRDTKLAVTSLEHGMADVRLKIEQVALNSCKWGKACRRCVTEPHCINTMIDIDHSLDDAPALMLWLSRFSEGKDREKQAKHLHETGAIVDNGVYQRLVIRGW